MKGRCAVCYNNFFLRLPHFIIASWKGRKEGGGGNREGTAGRKGTSRQFHWPLNERCCNHRHRRHKLENNNNKTKKKKEKKKEKRIRIEWEGEANISLQHTAHSRKARRGKESRCFSGLLQTHARTSERANERATAAVLLVLHHFLIPARRRQGFRVFSFLFISFVCAAHAPPGVFLHFVLKFFLFCCCYYCDCPTPFMSKSGLDRSRRTRACRSVLIKCIVITYQQQQTWFDCARLTDWLDSFYLEIVDRELVYWSSGSIKESNKLPNLK